MSAENVTVEKLFTDEFPSKFGKGMSTKTTIYTVEYPGVRMSAFASVDWKPGDTVAVEITKKGNFTNFKPVQAVARGVEVKPSQLEERVKRLEDAVFKEGMAEAAESDEPW